MNIKYLKAKIMLFNFYFINFFKLLTFKPLKKQISNAAATTITTTAAAYFLPFYRCEWYTCSSYFKYDSINIKIRYLKAKSMFFNFYFINFVEILTFKPLKKQALKATLNILDNTSESYKNIQGCFE